MRGKLIRVDGTVLKNSRTGDIMKCPNCSTSNPGSASFCQKCGGKLPNRKLILPLLVLAGLAIGVVAMFVVGRRPSGPGAESPASTSSGIPDFPTDVEKRVKVGIAFGSEKEQWFQWAKEEFTKTPAGRNIDLELRPMGSLEAEQAIVREDRSIHVWSPASALYKDVFLRDWHAKFPKSQPIVQEAQLALTPMVFVMWDERYTAFTGKYPELTFRSIGQAINAKAGWGDIAARPEWSFFKFSHTDPGKSNSGLTALLLMAADFHDKHRDLSAGDLAAPAFLDWVLPIERGLVGASSGLSSSTAFLMTAMIQRGWSTYDVVMVYESNAIERLQQANGRWGALKVVYPKFNFWNDNPYYILNAAWSSPAQREGAKAFMTFLLGETAQREALVKGFRPANVNVAVKSPDSPLVRFESVGLKVDVPGVFCEPPKAEVIESLLLAWQRSR